MDVEGQIFLYLVIFLKIPCYLTEEQLRQKLFDLQEQLNKEIEIHKEEQIEIEQPIFSKQVGLKQKIVQEGKEEAFENFLRKDNDIIIKELDEEESPNYLKIQQQQEFKEQKIQNESIEKIIVKKVEEESFQINPIFKKKKLKKLANKEKEKEKPNNERQNKPLNQFQRLKFEATLVLPTLDAENDKDENKDDSISDDNEQIEDKMILKTEEELNRAEQRTKIDPTLVLGTLNEEDK